jgi:hypothetical protein
MSAKTNDKFYNFLKVMADKIHSETSDTYQNLGKPTDAFSMSGSYFGFNAWHEAKLKENLIGKIIREYEIINGKPEEVKMIEIQDYIDPMNTEHMKAYLYMQTHGVWPDRFKGRLKIDNVGFTSTGWRQLVDAKIAEFWVKKHLLTSEYENVISGAEYGEACKDTVH